MSHPLMNRYFGRWRSAWQGMHACAPEVHWAQICDVIVAMCVEDVHVFGEQFLPYAMCWVPRWPDAYRVAPLKVTEVLSVLEYPDALALFCTGCAHSHESLSFILHHCAEREGWLHTVVLEGEYLSAQLINTLVRAPCGQMIQRVEFHHVERLRVRVLRALIASLDHPHFHTLAIHGLCCESVINRLMKCVARFEHSRLRVFHYNGAQAPSAYDWYPHILKCVCVPGIEQLVLEDVLIDTSEWLELSGASCVLFAPHITFRRCMFDVEPHGVTLQRVSLHPPVMCFESCDGVDGVIDM